MNKIYTYTTLVVFALGLCVAVGCSNEVTNENKQVQTDERPDSEKLKDLDLKIEKNPNDIQSRYERAKVLLNMNRNSEAMSDIDRALKEAPDNVDFLLLKADICLRNGNMAECYKVLQHAEEISSDNQEVLLKMGEITFDSKDYDRSLEYLSRVTKKDEDNRAALFMKGFIYMEKGDTASAVQFFRRVCDRYPDYAAAFEQLGVLYASRQEPLAVEYLNTAIQLEPSNTNALYALAMFYQNTEQMDEAESLYRQILVINPNSADAYHNLGWIELTFYHDYARAIEFFDKALEIDPQMENAIINRQLAIKESGK